jgi:spermidine synthase
MGGERTAIAPPARVAPGGAGARIGALWGRRTRGLIFGAAVVLFFICSGASGLIYQVAWVRILSLIFGVTVYAVSTVLAGFMAGLALGSYLAGRLARHLRRPLRAYGAIECSIGLAALFTPAAFAWLRDVYPAVNAWAEAQAGAWSGSDFLGWLAFWLPGVVRFLLAFGILLVPTTLMGATLPVMLRSSLVQGQSLGRSVSLLYAINTFGAIAGTIAAGFYLIAGYGVRASIMTAAALNVSIGVAAVLLSFVLEGQPAGPAPGPAAVPRRDGRGGPRLTPLGRGRARRLPWPGRRAAVLVAFGLSGLCALGYEVIWFRLLSLFAFDNSTYAFTVMLATVLFGIAAGSYLITPLMGGAAGRGGGGANRLAGAGGRINWWVAFAGLEWGIGVLAVLSITVLADIDAVVKRLAATWPALAPLTKADDGWMLLAAFVAIVPPCSSPG